MSTFGVAGPPTVNSDNQKERILARRERISERVEQIAEPNKPVVSQTREKVPSIAHDIGKYKNKMRSCETIHVKKIPVYKKELSFLNPGRVWYHDFVQW